MSLERTTVAFVFNSDLSLAQMKNTLEAGGQQEWTFGDSEWHGDYLGAAISADAVARIYATRREDLFHASLRFVAEAGDAGGRAQLLEAQRTLLEEVLPLVHARDVRAVEPLG